MQEQDYRYYPKQFRGRRARDEWQDFGQQCDLYYPKQSRGRRAASEWQDSGQQDKPVKRWHWTLIVMFWCGLALLLFVVFRVSGFR